MTNTCNSCFGISKKDLLDFCCSSPFPGTMKWPCGHPIWNCHVYGKISPKEAWSRREYLMKAIDNLYWILNKCNNETKYKQFVESHKRAFEEMSISLLEKVLNRFTVAKIAPKVTALPESLFYDAIIEANADLSSGIYCPMAGFGGIVRASGKWLKKHGIDPIGKIYAADINADFCDWYGWEEKDLLSEVVGTDMTVCVCPPFGDKTERWPGTPESMYYSFQNWVKLINKHIQAPQYLFFGPDDSFKNENPKCKGLFGRKRQARLYTQDEIEDILKSTIINI